MCFVPGYENDIFISYATVNNKPAEGLEHGWVTVFRKELERELACRLGREDLANLWFDESNISPGDEISSEIEDALQQTAILLIIMSDGYLCSPWCTIERNAFLEHVKKMNVPKVGKSRRISRIFIVEYEPVEKLPSEFHNIRSESFWEKDKVKNVPFTFGMPTLNPNNPDYKKYNNKINYLSRILASNLKLLKKEAENKRIIITDDLNVPKTHDIGAKVFVNAIDKDSDLAEAICERAWKKYGFGFYRAEGDNIKREDCEEYMLNCHGVIVVYGKSDKDWVSGRLMLCDKMQATRKAPYGAKAIVEGPPPLPPDEKEIPDYMSPNMQTIDCRSGLNEASLDAFFNDLQQIFKKRAARRSD